MENSGDSPEYKLPDSPEYNPDGGFSLSGTWDRPWSIAEEANVLILQVIEVAMRAVITNQVWRGG